jgi:divalent metal cation (Fe/Co/Zn/Cd) transporter
MGRTCPRRRSRRRPPRGQAVRAKQRRGAGAGCLAVEPRRCADDDGGPEAALLARGVLLEQITLGWNIAGIVILAFAALAARSVALAGFGLDSLIEIGASTVVLWELADSGEERQRRALRLIGTAFVALAIYIAVQSTVVLATGHHAHHSPVGIAWTAITAAVMFALASGKATAGRRLENPVLQTEGRVTFIDGLLASAVLIGLALNATAGWWWADPLAGYVIVFYGAREAYAIFTDAH